MIKQLILHKLLLEKRNAIACTSIMGAVILFFATIAADTYVDNMNVYRVDYIHAIGAANFAIWFCFLYTASRMFRDLNNRKTAIPFLMLPASNKDKFLANCIMGIGGTLAMFIIAVLGADIVQSVFNLATRYTTGSLTINYLESLFYGDTFIMKGFKVTHSFMLYILMVFWSHSIFTLGSTMFRKHSFIKTILSLFGAFLLLVMLIGCFASSAAYSNRDITINFLVDPELMFSITAHVIVLGTTAGAYYWAYRQFCNKTIL
jgi:hypothetical protein